MEIMTRMRTALAIVFTICGSGTFAADANNPDAAAVTNAMYAAVGAGNVDAAVSFFADDGYNIGPSGKKTTGKDELRVLISFWIRENVQIDRASNVRVLGDMTILRSDIASKWCDDLGISPVQVVSIVTMDGNKIKSVNGYYTLRSIERMTKACDARPDSKMPNGAPCGKGIPFIKKYTDSQVAQGIAESD
jgi:hypothetical protein